MRSRPGTRVRAFGVALAVALAAVAALPAQEWRGPEELEVRVEDAKGRPLAGVEVVLDYASRESGGPAPLLTDGKGRVAIGGLAPGRWALEVRKPGFMSFRAEIALSGGEKPAIVLASQHNVPGAVSTLRVRLGRSRNAPPAPARVERVAAAPPAPTSAAATPAAALPVAPTAAGSRTPVPAPTPAPAERPTAAPEAPVVAAPAAAVPAAEPAPALPMAAAAAPTVAAPAVPAPVAAPSRPTAPVPVAAPPLTPAPTPAPPVTPAPAPAPLVRAPAPAAPAPAAVPVVAPVAAAAPPARLFAAAPMARACYECRVGESALLAEAELVAGGAPCPAGLAARLAELPLAELPALAGSLPGGCAVLSVALPAGARYVGFRYEAAGGNGRSEDCLAGRDCPAGACRFAAEPVVRRDGDATVVLALFESSAARRAGLTVYWRRTR